MSPHFLKIENGSVKADNLGLPHLPDDGNSKLLHELARRYANQRKIIVWEVPDELGRMCNNHPNTYKGNETDNP